MSDSVLANRQAVLVGEGVRTKEPRRADDGPAAVTRAIEGMVATAASQHPASVMAGPLLGEVIDDRHPSLIGRVRVRWAAGTCDRERWVPSLEGLSIRCGDRVLLLEAQNLEEPIVIGVVDGFRDRPDAPRRTAASLELKRDETVRVDAEDGTGLVEIFRGERGPVVRLLDEDVDLELPGRLRLRAQSIALEATRGRAEISSSDDVVVRGEVIHLN